MRTSPPFPYVPWTLCVLSNRTRTYEKVSMATKAYICDDSTMQGFSTSFLHEHDVLQKPQELGLSDAPRRSARLMLLN